MESVPTELLVKFLALLNGYEIAKCRRVSRRFDDIVRNTVLLQYLIELDAAGYEDRPNASALSIGERFEALRESQRLWMNADIQAEAQIGPFKIGSEVLGYGQQRCYSDLASVLFVEMQPATDHTVTRIHLALPQYCDAVHVVPEQDLLLTAYGTRLHLLSLATQKQHERASREVLHMQTEFGPSDKMCVLRDLLVILPNEHHLAVYRWTSGELLGTHTSLHTICDVRIANGDFILALTSHNNEQMAVEVLGLFNLWAPSILSHKARFMLPVLLPELFVDLDYPEITHTPKLWFNKSICGVEPTCPIMPSDGSFFIINVNCFFLVLVPSLSFLPALHHHGAEPLVIPWPKWGPNGTRVCEYYVDHPLYVIGTSVLMSDALWNFNPLTLNADSYSEDHGHVNYMPTKLDTDITLQEDVITCLPYQEIHYYLEATPDWSFEMEPYVVESLNGPKLVLEDSQWNNGHKILLHILKLH
ncbi:unnamed protein product [Somion occarium]|uniref:F-box domain-containing protein n=1 Tax=Somion occarium TaxID=3059160 RepID=A0ABP1E516_9APHY